MANKDKKQKAKPARRAKASAKPVRKAAAKKLAQRVKKLAQQVKKLAQPAKKPAKASAAKARPAKGGKPKAAKEPKKTPKALSPRPLDGVEEARAERLAVSRYGTAPAGPAVQTVFHLTSRPGEEAESADLVLTREARKKMAHIDDATLAKIVARLDEMRIESQDVIHQHVTSDLEQHKEVTDVGDDLDQAVTERNREFDLIMHQRHLRRLNQVNDAFNRLQEGTYGFCEGTEEPINPKRLTIMPLARYSLEYQEQQEKMLGRSPEDTLGGEEAIVAEE